MGRKTELTDGGNLTDVRTGETHTVDAGTFNYYGYVRPDKSWVIIREKDDETEYRYAVGSAQRGLDYATAFAQRDQQPYKRADEFDFRHA